MGRGEGRGEAYRAISVAISGLELRVALDPAVSRRYPNRRRRMGRQWVHLSGQIFGGFSACSAGAGNHSALIHGSAQGAGDTTQASMATY